MTDSEFDQLPAEEKIERLRKALAAFATTQKAQGDMVLSLNAKLAVLRSTFVLMVIKLARQSGNAERYVMDLERLLAIETAQISQKGEGVVTTLHRSAITDLFNAIRKAVDPTGANT